MSGGPVAPGFAALSICEALLVSLTDSNIINAAEANAVLADAAAAHRESARLQQGDVQEHLAAAEAIEGIGVVGIPSRRDQSRKAGAR